MSSWYLNDVAYPLDNMRYLFIILCFVINWLSSKLHKKAQISMIFEDRKWLKGAGNKTSLGHLFAWWALVSGVSSITISMWPRNATLTLCTIISSSVKWRCTRTQTHTWHTNTYIHIYRHKQTHMHIQTQTGTQRHIYTETHIHTHLCLIALSIINPFKSKGIVLNDSILFACTACQTPLGQLPCESLNWQHRVYSRIRAAIEETGLVMLGSILHSTGA